MKHTLNQLIKLTQEFKRLCLYTIRRLQSSVPGVRVRSSLEVGLAQSDDDYRQLRQLLFTLGVRCPAGRKAIFIPDDFYDQYPAEQVGEVVGLLLTIMEPSTHQDQATLIIGWDLGRYDSLYRQRFFIGLNRYPEIKTLIQAKIYEDLHCE